MTESEAIARIRDHFEVHHHDDRLHPYLDEAVEMAIKALEKQIPKKPVERIGEYIMLKNDNGDEAYIAYYFCPTCNRCLDHNKPCCDCGQLLDWSDYGTVKWNRRVNDGKID